MRKYNGVLLLLITSIILISFRMIWINVFYNENQPQISQGVLDLRHVEGELGTINLDGQWIFYPSILLMENAQNLKQNEQYIDVPGGWNYSIAKGGDP